MQDLHYEYAQGSRLMSRKYIDTIKYKLTVYYKMYLEGEFISIVFIFVLFPLIQLLCTQQMVHCTHRHRVLTNSLVRIIYGHN